MNSPTMSLPEMDYDAAASDLATAIACLLRVNRTRRFTPDVARQLHAAPHASWLREFSTVQVGAGRRIGKTTLVMNLARDGDVALLGHEHLIPVELARSGRPGEPRSTPLGGQIVVARDFERFAQRTRLIGVGTIYVDEPHVVFRHNSGLQQDLFFGLLGALKFEGQIVLVGQA